MLPAIEVVDLSRLQFALTALYHFLFVPLTLGLSMLLAIMESVYVMTGRKVWRRMTQYWGILFGINFAMGVATGITMEFQFGTNWSYYSHYVGDIFGAPLAIEGLMAFFLEATFVGLFFFGWNKLSSIAHLAVTWLLAFGTNFSALWILIANGWMQNPVGSRFNFNTMRMEVDNFKDVIFNNVAQAKFVHTVSAGYVVASMFVLGISAYFLLRGRDKDFAKRSMTVAASFGLASALSVVVLGDQSGYLTSENQRMKLAGMEAMWDTEAAPAPLTVFGIPHQDEEVTTYKLDVPFLLGIIATRSFSTPIYGIHDLVEHTKLRITDGIKAYTALETLKKDPTNERAKKTFREHEDNLGYALLLKNHTEDVSQATTEQIALAAEDTKPNVPVLFWSFRAMAGLGLYFIAFFALAFYLSAVRQLDKRWFLWLALFGIPLPWISTELGWVVAEYGRQPWVIDGILPTRMGASSLAVSDLILSLAGFITFYSILAVIEIYLMVKYIKIGPESLLPKPQTPHVEKGVVQ